MTGRRALDLGVLVGLGAGLVGVSAWTAGWGIAQRHPAGFAVAFVLGVALWSAGALWVWIRRPPVAATLVVVLTAALAAGLPQVAHRPDTSGDIYRYVWDGRVQANGINPYRYAPADPALARLRDADIFPEINRRAAHTIYPPAAQALFAGVYLLHRDSVAWTKLVFVLLGAAATLALAALLGRVGRRPEMAILFAWHPLVLVEVARAGHVDVAATLLALLALLALGARRPLRAGGLLAAATLVKPFAAVLLPALAWSPGGRRGRRALLAFGATAVLAYVPFLGVGTGVLGYLPGYLSEEGFDSGTRFYLLALARRAAGATGPPPAALVTAYEALAVAAVAGLLAWWWRNPPAGLGAAIERCGGLLVVVLLLSTPSYPWYLVLLCALLPLLSPTFLWPAVVLTGAGELLYLRWWLPGDPRWPLDLAWGGAALALAAAGAWRARGRVRLSRPGRAPAARPAPARSARRPSAG